MNQTNKNANVRELENLIEKFADKKDTLLAMFALDASNDAGTVLTGNPKYLAEGFYRILKYGLTPDCRDGRDGIVIAILAAICKLLSEKNPSSLVLAKMFKDIMEISVGRRQLKDFLADGKDTPDDFDPDSDDCKKCDEFADCLAQYCKKNHIDLKPKREKPKKKNRN